MKDKKEEKKLPEKKVEEKVKPISKEPVAIRSGVDVREGR